MCCEGEGSLSAPKWIWLDIATTGGGLIDAKLSLSIMFSRYGILAFAYLGTVLRSQLHG